MKKLKKHLPNETKQKSPDRDSSVLWTEDVIQNFLQEDIGDYHSVIFSEKSCMRWAAGEILMELRTQSLPPLVVLENFRDKMEEYIQKSVMNKWIFVTGRDTAEYFIDILIKN